MLLMQVQVSVRALVPEEASPPQGQA
jgi:hypothetical protein